MKIIVIGGQAAGASAAAKAKRFAPNAHVCLYEKSSIVSFGACGLPYYLGQHFSDEQAMISRTAEEFIESGIDVRLCHEVIAIDPVAKTVVVRDGEKGAEFKDYYDRLILALGAEPITPPIRNVNLSNVFTLKTLQDAEQIKASLAKPEIAKVTLIGAGYIGLEVAEALYRLGKSVRIIQLSERILAESFDAEITSILQKQLEVYTQLHREEQVQALIGEGGVTGVKTDKGLYTTDAVIIATGVRPAKQLYQRLGLATLPNGAIVVDAYGQTSLSGIYAAGDCVALPHRITGKSVFVPLATGANKLGRIVGENAAGGCATFPGTLATAAIELFSLEAARTGLSEAEAIRAEIPYRTVVIKDKNHSNYVSGQSDMWLKLIYHRQDRTLLGGQIVGGKGSALRVDTIATAIWQKMVVDEFAMLDFLYAPPFARPWHILNIAGSVAK